MSDGWNEAALGKPARKLARTPTTSETSSIVNPAVKLLNTLPNVWSVRINAGGYRGRAQGAPEGTPDIIGSVGGKAFAIECKVWKRKTSQPSREAWLETLEPAQRTWYHANGHLVCYGVAYSVQDCWDLVKEWMR